MDAVKLGTCGSHVNTKDMLQHKSIMSSTKTVLLQTCCRKGVEILVQRNVESKTKNKTENNPQCVPTIQ